MLFSVSFPNTGEKSSSWIRVGYWKTGYWQTSQVLAKFLEHPRRYRWLPNSPLGRFLRWEWLLPFRALMVVLHNLSKKDYRGGAPLWLSRLGVQLRPRSWSHSSWVRALCQALCWQPGACFGFCVSTSLCPSMLMLCLSLSLNNKYKTLKKIFFKRSYRRSS